MMKDFNPTFGHPYASLMLLAAGLLVFSLFQFGQTVADRVSLNRAREKVETRIVEAEKVLANNQRMLEQLNAIAIGTQRLAEAGNGNAKEIVGQLGRLGIRINPNFRDERQKAGETPPETAVDSAAPIGEQK